MQSLYSGKVVAVRLSQLRRITGEVIYSLHRRITLSNNVLASPPVVRLKFVISRQPQYRCPALICSSVL